MYVGRRPLTCFTARLVLGHGLLRSPQGFSVNQLFKQALLATAIAYTFAVPSKVESAPNIVLILVDDLGSGDLGSHGADDMRTPRIDALMRQGTRFDQFYANCTVCSPSRASLLTGRYPDRVGVPGVIRQWQADSFGYLSPEVPTLPSILKEAGYKTAMIGKWHLGFARPNLPNGRGFDVFRGFLGDMMDDYWSHLRGGENWMRDNETTIQPTGHATDLFSDWSVDFIQQHQNSDQPFFLYVAYNAPHFPIQPPPEYLERVQRREPLLTPGRAANVAFVEHLDHGIGKILDAIENAGIAKDTLVVFTSDNGGSLPHHQSNGALRGGKQDHWEGGLRVPTCVVWPQRIPSQRTNHLALTMDLLPTLCHLAGATVQQPIDGQSFSNLLVGDAEPFGERTLFWVRREGNAKYQGRAYYAARKGPWKLLQNSPFEPMQLVNLENDPYETKPQPAVGPIADELRKALMAHIQRAGRTPWQPPE